jgi:glycosyltransferase involved in cell wall biosynthesis
MSSTAARRDPAQPARDGSRRVVVVMPAYNAAQTLRRTYDEVAALGCVDRVIVVDDASTDATVAIARRLPAVEVHEHERNRGYGANQKTCYRLALAAGADVVVMLHPDYQYTPKLIPAMVAMLDSGHYDCVLGSRILGGQALAGGMPPWRYVANRALTLIQNLMTGAKLSEFHTGYRAYSRALLQAIDFEGNSDDFVFDNQVLAQVLWTGHRIGEVTCPTRYQPEASSIDFRRAVRYGFGVLGVSIAYRLARWGLLRPRLFRRETAA